MTSDLYRIEIADEGAIVLRHDANKGDEVSRRIYCE